MRKTCLEEVYKLAKKDKRVIFVGSDLGAGVLSQFKKEMPDRFFMEGVSEQHIVGMISGLAMNGKIVYINTIASFLTRRCFEQIFIDVAMHRLNVRFIGSGGGLVYAPLGPTHLAFEDIALMKIIPNMTILAPADASEMKKLMPQTLNWEGPIYIRLAKGGDPLVTPANKPCIIGKPVKIKNGDDTLIITTGITLKHAIEASKVLSKKGIKAAILHCHTIKPLDKKTILKEIKKPKVVVTVEEGVINGGLGTSIAEIIAEDCNFPPKKFARIGLPDVFPDKYGSQSDLMKYYNITTENIVNIILKMYTHLTPVCSPSGRKSGLDGWILKK